MGVLEVWDSHFPSRDTRFAPIAHAASAFSGDADWPPVATWNERLRAIGRPVPVTFVPQRGPLRRRSQTRAPYDLEVARHGRVPSREGSWHDFLNMLAWAAFPRTKAAIHERQLVAAESREPAERTDSNRGRERDALSMLDEGGVLVAVHREAFDAVGRALTGRDRDALTSLRDGGACKPMILGHALYERLLAPDADDVFGAALLVPVEGMDAVGIDAAASERVLDSSELVTPASLARMPLGWIR